jgi:glycosyltransferase involved in cell wall biosynthesis
MGIHYYTEGFLQAGVQLSMLAMNTARHKVNINKLPELYSRLQHFETVDTDNRIKPYDAFINLFKQMSYHIDRFITDEYKNALIKMLHKEDFAIVQLEGLFLVPYIPIIRQFSRAKISIRLHNIEHKIWERLASGAKNPLKKMYLNLLVKRLKKYEITHLNDYDLVLPISEEDEQLYRELGGKKPVFLHPFGIDVHKIPFCPSDNEPLSLYHIGAMDWMPNQESVNRLIEDIMPLVNQQLPDLKLYLAGRYMPDYYLNNHWKNIEVAGEVRDAQAFETNKSILIVPLISGGGVRIKIFQGMAMGKTIITTNVGIEGIKAINGKHVLLANTPEEFAQQIKNVVTHPEKIKQIGAAARMLIEDKYDRTKLIKALLDRYEELIN